MARRLKPTNTTYSFDKEDEYDDTYTNKEYNPTFDDEFDDYADEDELPEFDEYNEEFDPEEMDDEDLALEGISSIYKKRLNQQINIFNPIHDTPEIPEGLYRNKSFGGPEQDIPLQGIMSEQKTPSLAREDFIQSLQDKAVARAEAAKKFQQGVSAQNKRGF